MTCFMRAHPVVSVVVAVAWAGMVFMGWAICAVGASADRCYAKGCDCKGDAHP